jgi:mRNA-degrading endonuclease toxin of MazEF toxin-antitoxin module
VTKRLNSVYEAEPSEPDPVLQLLQLRSLPKETKLPKDSVANVSQIITVDRAFLAEKVGKLPEQRMREVEDGLRLMLELS